MEKTKIQYRMSVEELVKLSGIENAEGFRVFDYAIPINTDGTYPYEGRAISVYWEGTGIGFELVPYSKLAQMALDGASTHPELGKVNILSGAKLDALRDIAEQEVER